MRERKEMYMGDQDKIGIQIKVQISNMNITNYTLYTSNEDIPLTL